MKDQYYFLVSFMHVNEVALLIRTFLSNAEKTFAFYGQYEIYKRLINCSIYIFSLLYATFNFDKM